MHKTEFKKLLQSLRYWLIGMAEQDPEYYRVLKALRIAESYHNGFRKDGSPEFSHQIAICTFIRTFHKLLKDPVKILIVALLHDTIEDYEESYEEIEREFPNELLLIVRISKVRNGQKIPYKVYFGGMQECEICSIVKLVDRIANISTMIGVFSYEKQTDYLNDLEEWFFPMLKYACRKFPEQEAAYQLLKTFLYMQKDTILKMREDLKQ